MASSATLAFLQQAWAMYAIETHCNISCGRLIPVNEYTNRDTSQQIPVLSGVLLSNGDAPSILRGAKRTVRGEPHDAFSTITHVER